MRRMGEVLSRPLPGVESSGTEPGQGGGPRFPAATARGRSTTVKRKPKGTGNGVEQAAHLRRGGSEQQQSHKPTQQ